MLFHKSPRGRGRWKVRTWVTWLSLAFTSACLVKNSRNRFIADLRDLSLGAHWYGTRRTQGNTCHATTSPVTSAVSSTFLIDKTLPRVVDWVIVQTFHACRERRNDDYRTCLVFLKCTFHHCTTQSTFKSAQIITLLKNNFTTTLQNTNGKDLARLRSIIKDIIK